MHPSTQTHTTTPTPPPFTPSPKQTADLFDDLADPSLSLSDIARSHNTSLDGLTLFLARPDIAARLAAIESAAAHRTRLVVVNQLPSIAQALLATVNDAADEHTHIPVNPKSLPAIEQRRRSRETTRRAAALLLRLAKFPAGPTSPTSSRGSGVPPELSSHPQHSSHTAPTALPTRHAEDEASPPSRPSSSPATPTPSGRCEAHPRVSPSPQLLPTSPSGPLPPWERPGEGSLPSLPSSYMTSALDSPSPSLSLPTSSKAPPPKPKVLAALPDSS